MPDMSIVLGSVGIGLCAFYALYAFSNKHLHTLLLVHPDNKDLQNLIVDAKHTELLVSVLSASSCVASLALKFSYSMLALTILVALVVFGAYVNYKAVRDKYAEKQPQATSTS